MRKWKRGAGLALAAVMTLSLMMAGMTVSAYADTEQDKSGVRSLFTLSAEPADFSELKTENVKLGYYEGNVVRPVSDIPVQCAVLPAGGKLAIAAEEDVTYQVRVKEHVLDGAGEYYVGSYDAVLGSDNVLTKDGTIVFSRDIKDPGDTKLKGKISFGLPLNISCQHYEDYSHLLYEIRVYAAKDSDTNTKESAVLYCRVEDSETPTDGENPVAYAVEGGNIYFDSTSGTIVGCDDTVTTLTIPEEIAGVRVQAASNYVFIKLPELKQVVIPKTLTVFYETQPVKAAYFASCSKLESITVAEDNPAFCSEDGVLFSKNKTGLLQYPAGNTRTSYTVPESVTYIKTSAFSSADHLTELVLPETMQGLDDGAIAGCHNIREITIPRDMDYMGIAVFSNCSSLKKVTIPADVKLIMPQTFDGCNSLDEVRYEGTDWQWQRVKIEEQNEPLKNARLVALKGNPAAKYTDLKPTAWYGDAVDHALEKGYFNGVSETKFAPDASMTRAMFVTVLHRMAGKPAVSEADTTSTFKDVEAGSWYEEAVNWALANKIVEGMSEDRFDPNGNVTREQMAVILHRYTEYKQIETKDGTELGFQYQDKDKISEWALSAMEWAVTNKILKGERSYEVWGVETYHLNPKDNATRAQVAQILYNFDSLNQ